MATGSPPIHEKVYFSVDLDTLIALGKLPVGTFDKNGEANPRESVAAGPPLTTSYFTGGAPLPAVISGSENRAPKATGSDSASDSPKSQSNGAESMTASALLGLSAAAAILM
jgi:hypothetical protein